MISTNIKSSHFKIENLFKSIFSDIPNTSIILNDTSVIIQHDDDSNQDAASIEKTEANNIYIITYWDGYSLVEEEKSNNLVKSLKIFKRFSKKLAKNLTRFNKKP